MNMDKNNDDPEDDQDDLPPLKSVEELKNPPSKADNKRQIKKTPWQERLLPLMSGLLIALSAFFFIATFVQMSYLHWSMLNAPKLDLQTMLDNPIIDENGYDIEAFKLDIQARMEAYLVEQRYRVATMLQMSSLWLRYLGFLTGMILALVGASFILGKLREPVSNIKGEGAGISLSLRSASPGIILVVLGALLMFTTIIDEDELNVKDQAIYFPGAAIVEMVDSTPTPDLGPLDAFFTPEK